LQKINTIIHLDIKEMMLMVEDITIIMITGMETRMMTGGII